VEVSVYAKNYWALVLLLLCVMVVFGNVLVILSVARERSLQNITNLFIVSLAVADLCVAGVVMPFYTYTMVWKRFIKKYYLSYTGSHLLSTPFALTDQLPLRQANWGEWDLPIEVCDFYLAMDVVCSTSSIFHLVAISIDRWDLL
jgi:hypothetical protein